MRPPRIVLAKPGLDGHDRGVKVIAMALRDAGAEVIYLGLRRSVAEIPVVLGGTIPSTDVEELLSLGAAAVFPVGTNLLEVVDSVLSLAARTQDVR